MSGLSYIRAYYRVPAKRGMRVVMDGRTGVIVGAVYAYLRIRFDDTGEVRPAHPTWRIEYPKEEDHMSREDIRQRAYQLAGGRETEVEAIAQHLHANESLHLHENVSDPVPCDYCYLRAGKALAALGMLQDGKLPKVGKRAICPGCGQSRALRTDGTMRGHKAPGSASGRCSGCMKKPNLPKSLGMGKNGPADLSQREGFGQ